VDGKFSQMIWGKYITGISSGKIFGLIFCLFVTGQLFLPPERYHVIVERYVLIMGGGVDWRNSLFTSP
jgi:hypothetical protein